MTRVRSAKTRQALLVLDGVFDPDNPPERLSLFDEDGNQLDFSPAHQIPPGGTTGQVLGKDSSADFDVEWVDAGTGDGAVVPAGGFTGQVLVKASDADGDIEWGAGGGGGFNWQGDWASEDYNAGSVVRYNKGLWLATGDTVESDIPGSSDVIHFGGTGDMSGDIPGGYGDWARLYPDEPAPFHVDTGHTLDEDWDFFFFDVITAGTLTVEKLPYPSFAWMNMYYGSTGVRLSDTPGALNYGGTLGVGRYFVLLLYSGHSGDGTVELQPGTAEIGTGIANPWELILQGDPDYDYD